MVLVVSPMFITMIITFPVPVAVVVMLHVVELVTQAVLALLCTSVHVAQEGGQQQNSMKITRICLI